MFYCLLTVVATSQVKSRSAYRRWVESSSRLTVESCTSYRYVLLIVGYVRVWLVCIVMDLVLFTVKCRVKMTVVIILERLASKLLS